MGLKHGNKRKTEIGQKCENRLSEHHAGGLGDVEGEGSGSRTQQIGTGGASGERRDSVRPLSSDRNTIAGGMLRQLIESCKRQKSIKLAEVEELDAQIENLEVILTDLEQRIRENP